MAQAEQPQATLNANDVADAVASVVKDPPPPLPVGWFLKESNTNPGYFYYFNAETGKCTWSPPGIAEAAAPAIKTETKTETKTKSKKTTKTTTKTKVKAESSSSSDAAKIKSESDSAEKSSKRRKTDTGPQQVRVLHILKKHKGSRRPSSWRQPNITQSLDEAREELQGLLEIVQEEANPDELRATFEELARTESDCSSAKRGGDLGFFGRRKMQPAFEAASFGLQVGELTKELVETSSGVHIILRIG
mmetsp:Transcript_20781/g.57743  ORF Transcript_20781/g.57743 Transcript_20781/m.57743 type:complete len:248 (-) Transcript_20781:982-1725(-)